MAQVYWLSHMARYLSAEHYGAITRKEALNPNKKKKYSKISGVDHCAYLKSSSTKY